MTELDIQANRKAIKWTASEQIRRVFWAVFQPAFVLSPRPLWAWRRVLLRAFGARIGRDVHIFPSVKVTIPWNLCLEDHCAIGDRAILYALGPIRIGARATISQGAHLCAGTHDWRKPDMPLLKQPIEIGPDVWVAADAFVGPNVTIGPGAILGARAVAMKDVPSRAIAVGNPAVIVSHRPSTG